MIWAVFIVVLVLIFGVVVRYSRRLLYGGNYLYNFSDEKFAVKVRRFLSAMPAPENGGAGVSVEEIKKPIEKAYKILHKKVKKGERLFEYEKWLYENHFKIAEALEQNYDEFSSLPHSGGAPRVVLLCKKVLGYLGGVLKKEQVELAFSEADRLQGFGYDEILAAKAAFSYAILLRIAEVSEKCVKYHRFFVYALNLKNIVKRYANDNVYVYYVLKRNPVLSEKLKHYMDKHGLSYDDVDYAFSNVLVENSVITENLVRSLLTLDETVFDLKEVYSPAKILEKSRSFAVTDDEGKDYLLKKFSACATKLNVSETDFAEKLLKAESDGVASVPHLVELPPKKLEKTLKTEKLSDVSEKTPFAVALSFFVIFQSLFAAAVSVVAALFGAPAKLWVFCALLSAFATVKQSYNLAIRVSRLFFDKKRILRVSEEADVKLGKTVVVVPAYVSSEKAAERLAKHVNALAAAERADGVDFLLLCDFAMSSEERTKTDENIEKVFIENLQGVGLAVRKRVYSDGKWRARERKRGALEDLHRYYEENAANLFATLFSVPEKPEYIVVLDEDSVLLPGEVKRAVLAAAHPENRGADMFAFSPKTNMFSLTTKFSAVFADNVGAEEYPSYSDDFQTVYGRGVFTGKGLYRLSAFHEKLTGRFPEKKLLSHDLMEGALVNTVTLDTSVFEEAPENFSQYFSRRLRWSAGDVALGYFLTKMGRSIPACYRLLLFTGAAGKLSAAFKIALMIAAGACGGVWAFATAAVIAFWKELSELAKSFYTFKTYRFRYAAKEVAKSLLKLAVAPAVLAFDGLVDLYVFITATAKVYGGKNMLVWKTFGSGKKAEQTAFEVKNAMLLSAAEKAYDFFQKNRVSGLIADNVSYIKKEKRAAYTSPTNVGFSLVAEMSAVVLGFKDKSAAEQTALEILSAADSLEKYRGNLFNWYDLETKKPLPPRFVSSVDSGNFVAALVACGNFFGGKVGEICKKLTKETDLGALYDKKRKQFYIGYNLDTGRFEGHYDLKISEARLLGYVYSALYKSSKPYFGTENVLSGEEGNTLYSWGGTMFEYLMPEIFLDTPKKSLVGSSAQNAVKVQIKSACGGVWGVSECGYSDVDECGNYRYEAFGLNALGLKSSANACVVSPYSSALALEFAPKEAVKNLENLKKQAYGSFGFFEAVDNRNQKPQVVREYMAHHTGMLLAAVANYLKCGAIRRAFMSDARMDGAKMLLTEPINRAKVQRKKDNGFSETVTEERDFKAVYPKNLVIPRFNLLKTDDYGVAVNDFGEGYSFSNGVFVTRFRQNMFEPYGNFFVVRDEDDDSLLSPTFSPLKTRGDYSAEFGLNHARFSNGNLSEEVFCPSFYCGETRILTLSNPHKTDKTYTVFFYSEPLLGTQEADFAHRSFNNLFSKTTEKTDKNGVLEMSMERRFPTSDKKAYMTLTAKGADGLTGVTDRFRFIGKNRTVGNALAYTVLPKRVAGDVSEPCMAFYGEVSLKPGEQKSVEVTLGYAENEKDALRLLERPKSVYFGKSLKSPQTVNDKTEIKLTGKAYEYFNALFGALCYVPYSDGKLKKLSADETGLSKTITSDFCRKALYFGFNEKTEEDFAEFLEGFEMLRGFGAECNLVVGYVESDFYGGKTYRRILSKIKSSVIGKEVFIVNLEGEGKEVEKLCFKSFSGFSEKHKLPVAKPKNRKKTSKPWQIDGEFDVGNGTFVTAGDKNFYVSKGMKADALPYSDVVAESRGGFVATDNGGGHSWFLNSRECKTTVWDPDTVSPPISEKFVLVSSGKSYSLTENSAAVFEKGAVTFLSDTGEALTKLTEYMLPDGLGKRYELEIKNKGKGEKKFTAITDFDLSLGVMPNYGFYLIEKHPHGISAKNIRNGVGCYLELPDEAEPVTDAGKIKSRTDVGEYYSKNRSLNLKCFASALEFSLSENESKRFCYTLYPSAEEAEKHFGKTPSKALQTEKWEALNPVKIISADKNLALLFDNLPYQTLSSRINARAAYYQVGGAFGFRDLLQDALSAIWFDPSLAREIILCCAAKIYEEGDAVHWWHNTGYGIRTRISDDRLFLSYVACEYASATGDADIFSEKAPYLKSKPLERFEDDRMEKLFWADYEETIREHILKTFKKTAMLGENGLVKVFGGDWNDALNNVGDEERGESVWLTMFFYKCVMDYVEYEADAKIKTELLIFAEKLKKAVDTTFENGYFKRMVTKKGAWLGSEESPVLKIDVISQAWAVISEIADKKKTASALEKALELVSDDGIIRLLWPPANEESDLGYISKYPEGVRENGGQYTHGAVWLAQAFLEAGKTETGYKLLSRMNPIWQNLHNPNFRGEPYVLSADVYVSENEYGRAGWSWYTGSASWCYKVILEDLLGLKLFGGNLKINPKGIPDRLDGTVVTVKRNGGTIEISYKKGASRLVVDGVNVLGNDVFPFRKGKTLKVEVWRE